MTINTGRKVRADAKLERLDAAQQERLRGWLEDNSYSNVVDLVRKEFGLSVGKSAVGLWWRRHVLPERQQDDAESIAELAALPPGDFSAATLQRAWALAFEALARPFPEIDRAAKLIAIVSKLEQHALALKRLEVQERRVALQEKLAAVQLQTKAGGTTKNTKRPERGGESAGTEERSEGAEVAAKARSCEGRSEGAEAAKLAAVVAEPGPMPTPVAAISSSAVALSAGKDSPRFPGYSGAGRHEAQAGVGTTKGHEKNVESPGVAASGVGAEVAAKAQRAEGRSEGAEVAKVSGVVAKPVTMITQSTACPRTYAEWMERCLGQ